jgi:hypothetical protein
MKRKQPKARATLAQALAKTDLNTLMALYEQLYRAHDSFYCVPDYDPALDVAVQNQVAWPLERALNACADALKRAKTKGSRETELRAALLYNHALRFDADNNKARRAILCEALLAIPTEEQMAAQKHKAAA